MISMGLIFLIVDDFPSVRLMVKTQLKQLGFKGPFFEANNVAQARKILVENFEGPQSVDFIISDWLMPEETGLDLLNYVRNDDRFKGLPFLVLTTENEKETILDTLGAGASQYLLKPWTITTLQEKLEKAWQKHQV